MVTRIGGLASGMDIDSMVEKLMTAEKSPLNKLYQKKQISEWQRDSYRSLNTKMKTFSDYTFDNILLSSNFVKKTPSTNGTNSSKVTVNASAGAAGNLDIQAVKQLATTAKTSAITVDDVTNRLATKDDTLGSLGITAGSINLKVGETTKTVSVGEADTIEGFINNLKSQGFTNSKYDTTTGKFTIAGATGSTYTIADTASAEKLKSFGFSMSPSSTSTEIVGATNTTKLVDDLGISAGVNTFNVKVGNETKSFTIDSTETISTFLGKLNATGSGVKASFDETTKKFSIAASTAGNTLTVEDTPTLDTLQKLGVSSTTTTSSSNFVNAGSTSTPTGSSLLGQLGAIGLKDGSVKLNVIQSNGETKETEISYSNADTIDSFIKRLNTSGAGVTALFSNGKLTIGANNSGSVKDGSTSAIQVINDSSGNGAALFDRLGFDTSSATGAAKGVVNTAFDLATTEGQDAIYAINGLVMESNSNLINVSGYEINLNGTFNETDISGDIITSSGNTISVSSTNDIGSMVDKIKEFVTKYNEFIGGINEQLKETKYRDYTPLTEEQRKDMSENEQKLWDEKAQSGLLRSDDLLRKGLSDMRSALGGRVNGLGDNVIDTMAEMGITTSSSYNDGGKLVIDETKLRKSLTEDPDRVINTLTQSGEVSGSVDTRGVVYRLRDAMTELTKKIDAKAGRTTMTDSQYAMGKNLVDMEKRISVWKDKLENIESRYWKQFTAMEKAINKANEQSSLFTTA